MYTSRSLAVAAAAALACTTPAHPQDALGTGKADTRNEDALGDGTALDASLEIGSGGVNRSRSLNSNLALRNAMVARPPAGMNFRGDVGYAAVDDFRRELSEYGYELVGAEDLYANLSDSYTSFLASRNLRGIHGIQQQFEYTIGGQIDETTGIPITRRPASVDFIDKGQTQETLDVYGNLRGTLRSTSEWYIQRTTRPEVLGQVLQGGEPMYVTASPLHGVRTLPTDNPTFLQGIESAAPTAAPRPGQVEIQPVGAVEEPHVASMHATVLESLRVRVESDDDLRRRLAENRAAQPTATDTTPPDDAVPPPLPSIDESVIDELDVIRRRLLGLPSPGEEADESQFDEIARRAAELLGGEGPIVEQLRPDIRGDAVYARHMERGSEALGEARWFDAEERFSAALGIRPGDAAAAVGRIHAQIGAGMLLSAAINLRSLYQAYPEMIAVRFDGKVLPGTDRMERIRNLLRTNAEQDTAFARDAALLLAYLGRQYRIQEDLLLGLNRMGAIRVALETGPDPLEDVLRAAWIE